MTYQQIKQFARELRKNQTPAEAFFWEKVRNRRFLGKKINRQFIIQHENIMGKRRFFIADFYCHEHKLVIEIDGGIHGQKDQLAYDRIREDMLEEMGYAVVRFRNEEVLERWEDVAGVLAECLAC
jgi:very-short-patch-repair endonuclease